MCVCVCGDRVPLTTLVIFPPCNCGVRCQVVDSANPIIFSRLGSDPTQPTIVIHGHYDVQVSVHVSAVVVLWGVGGCEGMAQHYLSFSFSLCRFYYPPLFLSPPPEPTVPIPLETLRCFVLLLLLQPADTDDWTTGELGSAPWHAFFP